jgi:hypothetical protein
MKKTGATNANTADRDAESTTQDDGYRGKPGANVPQEHDPERQRDGDTTAGKSSAD